MDNTSEKRRGAPKGRRPVSYICGAVVNNSLAMEEIFVKDQDPDSVNGSFPEEHAISEFFKIHGVKPEKIICSKKGVKKSQGSRKKLQFDRENIDQYQLSPEQRKAEYGNLIGLVHMCDNDTEKALFIPIGKKNEDETKKTANPAAGIVPVSKLVFENDNI